MHLVIELEGHAPPAAALQALDEGLRGALNLRHHRLDPLDPHSALERLLGGLRGLGEQAALPLAAWQLDERRLPWVFLSPVHLQFDASQVVALPVSPDAPTSHQLWDTLAPLFPESEGWQRAWLDANTWALAHEQLADLRLASLSRVIDRPLAPWLPQERSLRRWTNEAQMLLHTLPQPASSRRVNSVWWWGAGRYAGEALPEGLHIVKAGEPWPELPRKGLLSLTGERGFATVQLGALPWWQPWRRGPRAAQWLETLC